MLLNHESPNGRNGCIDRSDHLLQIETRPKIVRFVLAPTPLLRSTPDPNDGPAGRDIFRRTMYSKGCYIHTTIRSLGCNVPKELVEVKENEGGRTDVHVTFTASLHLNKPLLLLLLLSVASTPPVISTTLISTTTERTSTGTPNRGDEGRSSPVRVRGGRSTVQGGRGGAAADGGGGVSLPPRQGAASPLPRGDGRVSSN